MNTIKSIVRTVTFPARAAFDGYLRFERWELGLYQSLFFKGLEVMAGDALTAEEHAQARTFVSDYFDTAYNTARVKFGVTDERILAPVA